MKRIISFLLLVLMITSCMVCLPTATAAETAASRGDVNRDGFVSAKDVLLIRKFMAGQLESRFYHSEFELLADVHRRDNDGRVNAKDLRALKMYLVCAIDNFDDFAPSDDKPTVTIAGVALNNFEIVIPAGYETENYNARLDGFYYYYLGTSDEKNVSPAHYAARSLNGFSNAFVKGDQINVVYDANKSASKKHIYLVIDNETYGKEGFNIKVENGEVYITGANGRGIIYGTTEFLERYFQGKFLGDYADAMADLEKSYDIPNGIDYTCMGSPFKYRAVVGYPIAAHDAHNYTLRRKINGFGLTAFGSYDKAVAGYAIGRLGRYNAHSIYPYTNNFADSLDYYEATPCLNSKTDLGKDTFNKVIASLKIEINEEMRTKGWTSKADILNYPEEIQFSCSMQDNNKVCPCKDCMDDYRTYGSFNAVYFDFLNRVADYFAIEEGYGDSIKFFSILYDRTYPAKFFEASENNLPRSNMILCYCMAGCNNHTLDGEGCKGKNPSPVVNVTQVKPNINSGSEHLYEGGTGNSIGELDRIKAFGKLSDDLKAQNGKSFDLYFWYYPTNVAYFMCPSPNYFNIRKDMRLLADAGVDGIYFEADSNEYAFEDMRAYLAMECMWNPYMSDAEYEYLMDNWLATFCGDGWRYIKQYLLMNEEASNLNHCWVNNYDSPWTMVNKQYYADNYFKMTNLFQTAYYLADDNKQRDFINRARAHCDFLGLSALWNQRDSLGNQYYDNYDRMYNYMSSSEGRSWYYGEYVDDEGVTQTGRAQRSFFCIGKIGDTYKGIGSKYSDPMTWY